MTETLTRRTRKSRATRRTISEIATRLFLERGFDQVTIDDVAEAADVGRKTVFYHFSRKEDLFFDQLDEVRDMIRNALRERAPGVAPLEALRALFHRLFQERNPYLAFTPELQSWIETLLGSEALKDRARALRDHFTSMLADLLTEAAGHEQTDLPAELAAGLLLATWTVAFVQSRRDFQQHGDEQQAQAIFLSLLDLGTISTATALRNTPYA